MKKILLLIILTALLPAMLSGCNDVNDVDVEIGERYFMTRVTDIMLNYDHYIGRTVRYEGVFERLDYFGGIPLAFVYRRGPGCCGDDGWGGFMVLWEDGRNDLPENNDWVEVVGTFGVTEVEGVRLRSVYLSSLTVLEVRGEDFVWN